MTYRIHPLPLAPFQSLFALSDAALEARGARRMIVETPHSAPCRVSLKDAQPGETLILTNHRHLDVSGSPYRADGPIFVRQAGIQAEPITGAIPDMLRRRLLSLRVYDAQALMIDADVLNGEDLDARLRAVLLDPAVAQVHLHTARRGCYLARATRSD